MIARASQLFLPTLRDDPADAEAATHKLLVRGGFVRQVSAGVWTFLPLGWRVHQKIEQIIREEMDAIGGQEMLMPVLTPFELWKQSGRDYIQEIFRLKDRKGADYVLPLTHEETVTFHARELQSYRQLPQMLYHFSIKERDEPRPGEGPHPAARVHHEGLVLVRPRRGGPRRAVRQASRRVSDDLRSHRGRGALRRRPSRG